MLLLSRSITWLLLISLLICSGAARKVKIFMVCGIVFDLEVTSKTKIRRIKEKIHKLRKIPPWDQALMFGAVILRDDLTLRDYGTPERLDLIIFSDAVFPPKATISGSPSIKLASNTSSIDM